MKRLLLAAFAVILCLSSLAPAAPPIRVVRADRLELLARRIESLKPNQLNMYNWTPRSARPAVPGVARVSQPDDDAYCAGGHATQIFASDGFRWPSNGDRDVVYGALHGSAACAAFFGISKEDADWLFTPIAGHDPKTVAASIRRVARESQARLVLASLR